MCNLPGGPLQPMESYCCHPTSHYRNHIPKEEHQFLILRLFGFLLIKQSIYKVLNKYTAVSDASVSHSLGELSVVLHEIPWKATYQMQSRLQNDSTLQTHCSSPGCSPHPTHTHTFIHTHSYLGRRVSALCNLDAWEMFVLISQTHSGRGKIQGSQDYISPG